MPFQAFFDPFGTALQQAGTALKNESQSIENATNLYKLGMVKAEYTDMLESISKSGKSFADAGGQSPNTSKEQRTDSNNPSTGLTSQETYKLYQQNIAAADKAKWFPAKAKYYSGLAEAYLTKTVELQKNEYDEKRKFMDDFANAATTAAKSPEEQGRALAELQERLPPGMSLEKVLKGAGIKTGLGGQVNWDPKAWETIARHSKTYLEEEAHKQKLKDDARKEAKDDRDAKRLDLSIQSAHRLENAARDRENYHEEAVAAKAEATAAKKETKTMDEEIKVSNTYNTASKDFQGRSGIRTNYETAERYIINPKTGLAYNTTHFDAERDNALLYAYISAIHPEHRGSIRERKDVDKLTALPAKFAQEFKSLIDGRELSEQTRLNMFNAIKEKFITENQQQKERENAARFKLKMINPDATDAQVEALVPKHSLGPDEIGLDYFEKKHGEE